MNKKMKEEIEMKKRTQEDEENRKLDEIETRRLEKEKLEAPLNYDALVDELRVKEAATKFIELKQKSEFDETKRRALAKEFHQLLYDEQPYTFFYTRKRPVFWQPESPGGMRNSTGTPLHQPGGFVGRKD